MRPNYLVILAEPDPIAQRVAERWGTPPSTGEIVDGVPIRSLSNSVGLLRRSTPHIHDDHVERRLPARFAGGASTLVFASVHRSESEIPCFTVHPLGNLGPTAEVGGEPFRLVPAAPRLMTDALRRLAEAGTAIGWSATFEATHHGPSLAVPAFFAEIGAGKGATAPDAAVRVLADVLADLDEDGRDRVVVGLGGGHYVPHFTEVALARRWAFGHLLSRHALADATEESLGAAIEATPGAEGVMFARAADAEDPRLARLGRRLREGESPRRRPAGPEDRARPGIGPGPSRPRSSSG